MKTFVLLSVLIYLLPAKHISEFYYMCKGHSKCYSVWDDPYSFSFWAYNDLAFWAWDWYVPPYVSFAESSAMAATFTLRFLKKIYKKPTSRLEWISAAHILLTMHENTDLSTLINCTAPSEWGSFSQYASLDDYLYNDADIPFGPDSENWCDYPTYNKLRAKWNGRVRYNYLFMDYEDTNKTYSQIAYWFWCFGLHLTTTSYCPDITSIGATYIPNDKYYCDPNTPGAMWGTVVIFGVMEDVDGLWYAAYFMEATSVYNRLQWIRPSWRYFNETLQFYNYVYESH